MARFPNQYLPPFSPATLVINLENLRHNLDYFRGLLSGQTRIMAMVKADAYGCGAVEVSRALNSWGVEDLGVAYTQEGIELRKSDINGSIMVMNPVPQDFPELVHYHLEPELSSLPLLKKWVEFIRKEKLEDYPIHIEVDTGLHRLGFDLPDVFQVALLLYASPAVKIKSVFSHLASSPLPDQDEFTRQQFDRFESWCEIIQKATKQSPLRHILNSAGIARFPDHQYDIVRLGIGLYGVGLESLPVQQELRPVQSLFASISQVKEVSEDESIGYERKGRLKSNGRIAVLNIGYADGLPRLAGNGRFSVRIGDVLCPVAGSICMDMTMVDVSECPEAEAGKVVEIYGVNHPIIHLANAAQTIPYEILTGNRKRIRRFFKNE